MPPSYYCAHCGTLALPTNSNLTADGTQFIHRTCRDLILQADPEWDDQTEKPAR